MTYPGDNWARGGLGGATMRSRLQSLTNAVTTLISSPATGATQSYVDAADSALSTRVSTLEAAPSADPLTLLQNRFVLTEDFPQGVVGSYMTEVKLGTGTGSGAQSAFATGLNGILQLSTGTTATGYDYIGSLNSPSNITLGYGTARFTGKASIGALSDGTNNHVTRIGIMDVFTGAAIVDGVWFEYDSTTSANWLMCTSSNSSLTRTATSVAVDTSYHRFDITINQAATSAVFSIDGTSVGTVTTNIPSTGARSTFMGAGVLKTLGTTAVLYRIDYLGMDVIRN